MLNRKVADTLGLETTMGSGHYALRLPSYRSSHARRYHPYPAVRRYDRNDELYKVRFLTTLLGTVPIDSELVRIFEGPTHRLRLRSSRTRP